MKTKIILLLCALMGVLNTFGQGYMTTLNDSVIYRYQDNISSTMMNLNDSAKYNTLVLNGIYTKENLDKLTTLNSYDTTLVHLDMTSVNMVTYIKFTTYTSNILPARLCDDYINLKTIKLPSTCDTLFNTTLGYGKKTQYTLDSVYITNQTKVMEVKIGDSPYQMYKVLGNSYVIRTNGKDSIVVMVPRALFSAYKARTGTSGQWYRFKIVAYDVPAPIFETSDASLSSLSTSFGKMSPTFSKNIHKYNITIPNNSEGNPAITAKTTNVLATVTQKYSAKTSSQYSGGGGYSIYDTLYISVLASDGKTYGNDTITFAYEAPNTDATLKSLKFDVGTLSPALSPTVFEYDLLIPDSITKTPIITEILPTDSNAFNIYVDTTTAISCSNCFFNITIAVTAEDPNIFKTYYIKIKNENTTEINQTILKGIKNSIYPTITKDVINIDGIESGQISIVDLNGNILIKDEIQPQINVSKLTKGIYMVMVNNSCVGKIIKQ